MLDIKVSQDDDEDGQQKKQERYDGIMRQVLGLAPGTALPLLPPNPDQAHHSVEHGIPEDLGQFKRHRQLPYLEQLKHLSKVLFCRVWFALYLFFSFFSDPYCTTFAKKEMFMLVLPKTVVSPFFLALVLIWLFFL